MNRKWGHGSLKLVLEDGQEEMMKVSLKISESGYKISI